MPKMNHAPAALKKLLTNIVNIVIYDQVEDSENYEYLQENNGGEDVQFIKVPVNSINSGDLNNSESLNKKNQSKKYNLKKKYIKTINQEEIRHDFIETFEAVRKEKKSRAAGRGNHQTNFVPDAQQIEQSNRRVNKNFSFGVTTMPEGISQELQSTKTAVSIDEQLISGSREQRPEMQAEEKRKLNLAGAAKRLFSILFAVLCGGIVMPFGMNPLGIALICAADKYIFYIYSGLLISLIFVESNTVIFFGLYTITAGIKIYLKYMKDKAKTQMLSASPSYKNLNKQDRFKLLKLVHFNDAGSVITSVLVCAVASAVVGFLTLALKIDSLVYADIIIILLFALTAMLFTYLYSGLFDVGADDKTLEKAGFCAVIFTIIYFLAPYYILVLSLGFILSLALTLTAASSGNHKDKTAGRGDYDAPHQQERSSDEEIINRFSASLINKDNVLSDMTRGALTGLLCGIALGDTAGAVILGLCGLVSGLFFAQSRALALIAGIVSSASYAIYITGVDAAVRYIPNIITGFALYIPASIFYANIIKKRVEVKESGKSAPILDRGLLVTELPAGKLGTMSEAFHSLSVIFSEFAERMKLPSTGEIKIMAEAAFDKTCVECENRETCRLAGIDKSNAARKCADYIKYNKRLENAGMPRVYLEECMKSESIKSRINELYCSRLEINAANDKTDIFASNFENISNLLQNNIKAGKEDIAFKKDISSAIYNNLEEMGIECDNVIAIGERKKAVYIFGIKMVNYAGTIQDITDMLERVCGTCFGDPEYILRDDYIIMKSQSKNKLKIYSMYASKSAEEIKALDLIEPNKNNHINGDSISVFDGRDGFCYGLISDGMGSGRNAALSSHLTTLVMEKLLGAGNQKDLTLEILNSLLLSKNDECFASVDLFEADLITGTASFIKAGAAPSFIIRAGRLFKIQSSTVPAGIISGINSEQTKFELETGDYIIMFSDGILSTFEEGAWLFEMLESERNLSDPANLLNNILNEASHKSQRKDDMSVLFMRVAEA